MIDYRDTFDPNSEEWEALNHIKADWLEEKKPSTKENIIYFDETSMVDIPEGFSTIESLPKIPFKIGRRSILEYNPEQRHPIPYCIVRHKKRYFFILRESGSGEIRLIGKKGLLGGHVAEEDVIALSLNKSILNGLKRELQEEAGITAEIVQNIHVKGLIKSNEGVDSDHLGVIYEIVLDTDEIKAEEEGALTGIWIHERELPEHYDSFESWSKIVYDHLLKKAE
ncbi:hypothetical protein CVD28_24605 [Bacillus sp. M6-12]|nr:hypothetical protein CVD28_24605 [Bacillus sp. M6-12]